MSTYLRISINLEETQEEPEDQYRTAIILKGKETPKSSCGDHGRVLQTDKIFIGGYEEEYEAMMKLEKIFERPFTGLLELILLRGVEQGIKYANAQKKT